MPLLADAAALRETVHAARRVRAAARARPHPRRRGARLHVRHARSRYELGVGFAAARKPGQAAVPDDQRRPTRWSTARTRSSCTWTPSRPACACWSHDDLLATGGTAKAKVDLVEQLGGDRRRRGVRRRADVPARARDARIDPGPQPDRVRQRVIRPGRPADLDEIRTLSDAYRAELAAAAGKSYPEPPGGAEALDVVAAAPAVGGRRPRRRRGAAHHVLHRLGAPARHARARARDHATSTCCRASAATGRAAACSRARSTAPAPTRWRASRRRGRRRRRGAQALLTSSASRRAPPAR